MPLIINSLKNPWTIPNKNNKSINSRKTSRKSSRTLKSRKKIMPKDKSFLKKLGFKVLV